MKNYFTHLQSKTPHERRTHSMQVAGGVTALALVIWASTLGLRFASTPPQVATDDPSQMASVVEAQNGNATLIVATTTTSNTAFQQGY